MTLAVDDVNGDGIPDLVVGAGPGGGPEVKVFNGADLRQGSSTPSLLADFFAFAPSFSGGVTFAVDDVNGDGIPDLVVGAGPGGGPEVKVFNGADLRQGSSTRRCWPTSAFAPSFSGGVTLAVDDVNGDGIPDLRRGRSGRRARGQGVQRRRPQARKQHPVAAGRLLRLRRRRSAAG